MNIDLAFVLGLALSNIGIYLSAPPPKKREVGAQAVAGALAVVGSYYVIECVYGRLTAAQVPFAATLFLMILALVAAYLTIGLVTWRLLRRFVPKP